MKKMKIIVATAMMATATFAAGAVTEGSPEMDFGSIAGRITDSESHTLPGATIIIFSAARTQVQNKKSTQT